MMSSTIEVWDAATMVAKPWLVFHHCGREVCHLCRESANGPLRHRHGLILNYTHDKLCQIRGPSFEPVIITTCVLPYWSYLWGQNGYWSEVTMFQLEKLYGKSKEAKEFISKNWRKEPWIEWFKWNSNNMVDIVRTLFVKHIFLLPNCRPVWCSTPAGLELIILTASTLMSIQFECGLGCGRLYSIVFRPRLLRKPECLKFWRK